MSELSEGSSGAVGRKDALPIARVLEQTRGGSLRGDVIGGISACVVMIPSGIAYADLVGLPPAHGLYAALAGMLGLTQFEKLLGVKLHEREFFPLVAELARKLPETHVLTFALGIGFLAMLGILRHLAPRLPGALVVFVLGTAVSAAFGIEALGVEVVGDVPSGLPHPVLPAISAADLRNLFPIAIGIALLAFPEGILVARAFAAKNGYDVEPERELRALGAANVAAGLLQGFPVGASQTRTSVNDAAGGRTQLASLVAAAALLPFLFLLTPILRLLPMVALGAIVIFAGAQLVDLDQYARLYRIGRLGFVNALLVTIGVLLLGVAPGIVVGVMLSLILLLGRLARPADAVLQRVPGTASFHDVGDSSATETVPGLIAYRFYAPLVFANADHFMHRVRGLVAASRNRVRCVLVDVQAVTEIDVTAAEMMLRLGAELDAQGIDLKFARANRPLREQIVHIGLGDHLDKSTFFPSVHAAIEAYLQQPSGSATADFDAVPTRRKIR